MKKIFVDMDGVLTNFERRYFELFQASPKDVVKQKEKGLYTKNWNVFVDGNYFATLDKFPGCDELVSFLESIPKVQLCVLSSAGGFDRHIDVQSQKLKWLADNGIKWPAIIVPGRRYKSGFATGDSFMIDDTPDVIKGFCENTGHGIVHVQYEHTIQVLTKWLIPV